MPKDSHTIGSTDAHKVFDLPLTLHPGQVNTLSFSQDSISSMQLLPKGELQVTFHDGSRLIVENFEELANSAKSCGRDTIIQLSDNTIIYPEELQGQLAQGPVTFDSHETGLVAFAEPAAGAVVETNIEAGREYQFDFNIDHASAAQAGQNLILTFPNGGVLILNNYFAAVNSELPPVMTLADGAVVDSSALLSSCKLVEIPTVAETVAVLPPEGGLREAAPDIEPAAGEPAAVHHAAAPKAEKVAAVEPAAGQDLANIEPAAGDAGASPVSSSRGYGFGSSIDGASFNGESPIGPIAPTALNYSAPTIPTIPYVSGLASVAAAVPVDDVPDISSSTTTVDETHLGSVSGSVSVDYGHDGPGVLSFNDDFLFGGSVGPSLLSCQVPVVVTHTDATYTGTANGSTVFTLVIDPATGEYTFTQYAPLTHADPTNPDDVISLIFGVTATDADGDSDTASIVINVHDDGPVAVDDVVSIGASDPLLVSGNVLTNDNAGTDGNGHVTAVNFNGTNYAMPAGGSVTITGQYGSLVLHSDGAYSYTSFNTGLGTDHFTYTLVDCDGDSDTAILSVKVADLDTVPTLDIVPKSVDETLVDESGVQTVTGTVVADFGADGPGTVALAGVAGFAATGSLAGGSLTSNGVPVVVTQSGNQYVGTAGGEVIFELTLNPDNSYEFQLHGQLDHADATDPNDVIALNFDVVATDSDGDTATGTITINVYDDAPVAVNDVVSLSDANVSVSGNVTTNDYIGEDQPGYIVSDVTFNGVSHPVSQGGTVTITGAYGVLVIASSGAYTYTSNNSAIGTDQFVYTIKDQDGDPASATLTVTVKDIDEQPCVENELISVDETYVDDHGSQTVSGVLTHDFLGDGPGTVNPVAGSFAFGGSLKGGALTSNGVPVVVTLSGDTYTGKAGTVTIFTLTIQDDGSYTYKQFGQLDHADATNPDDVITLNFGFVATDADGDTAQGTVIVQVHDDAPVAVNDVATLSQAPGSVSGNVTTNDDIGEDTPGYMVKTISFNGQTVTVPVSGAVTIAGDHGTLSIKADGSYTYTGSTVGSDVFTYKIVDQDGDPATAKLTVTVSDVDEQPTVINSSQHIDESNLGPIVVNGSVSPDYHGDGPGVVTARPVSEMVVSGYAKGGVLSSSGVPVVVTLVGNTYIGKAGSKDVFTLQINSDGTYQFKLLDNLDHSLTTNPDETLYITFGVTATDADGDKAIGKITIGIDDDGPVAVNDVATLSQAPGSVSGNVTTNDDIGEDAPGYMVKEISFNGQTVTVPVSGAVTITGNHGTLSIKADGSYTYTGSSVGSDVFAYKIVDQDGDPASATLTVTVKDIDEQPCVENELISVDETYVDDHGSQTVSGVLTHDFLGDGPGTVNPVAGSFAFGGSLKGGALTSNGVPVVVTLSGDTYTGKAGTVTIFTLTIQDDGSYTYKQFGQLDHADATNPDDVITLNFGFVATDADGDTAQGTVIVQVHDDAPVAVNDVATLSQAPGSVSGNVTTNDDIGEDTPGYMVKTISFNGQTVTVPVSGAVTIAGDHGTLSIKADGSYTYTGSTVGSDVFTYKIVDQDGDPATAKLTVTVSDVDEQPTVINSSQHIDESNLGPIVVNGSVSPDYHGDGPGVVTARPVSEMVVSGYAKGGVLSSSGVPVVVTLVGNTYIGKAGSKDVFTLQINSDGTYQFKLLDNLDHSLTTNPDETLYITFGVTATDADGDKAIGKITIGIDDDGPVAVDDHATVLAGQTKISGDVDLNDDIGEDFTANGVAFVKYGSTTYTVPATGTVTINATYGTLVIGSNGQYSYTVHSGTAGGQEVFTYTLRDTDMDTATAKLVIDVAPHYLPPEPPLLTVCDVCVYEDGHTQLLVTAAPNGGNGNDVITLSISGFKAGWVVDTTASGGTYNANTGVWSITLAAGQSYDGGPVVYPPHNSDVDLNNLVVTANVYDPDSATHAQTTASMNVVVDAVADAPNLALHDVYAIDASAVVLDIDVSLKDTDGSEIIKEVRIEGVPDGFTLNHGVYDSATDRWVLSESQLDGLQIHAPTGFVEGQFNLLVTAVSQEKNLSGEECTTANNLAYKADVVTVTFYEGDCNCGGTTNTTINVNVSSSSSSTVIMNGEVTSSTSDSSSSSYSSTTTTTTQASSFDPVVITGFDAKDGDILDLSSLIDVQDPLSAAIQDFVFARTENGNTIISVDADGTADTYCPQDVIVLQGVTNVHVEDIVRLTTDQSHSGLGTA